MYVQKEHLNLIIVDTARHMCIAAYFLSILFRIPFIIWVRTDIWTTYEEQKEYYKAAKKK